MNVYARRSNQRQFPGIFIYKPQPLFLAPYNLIVRIISPLRLCSTSLLALEQTPVIHQLICRLMSSSLSEIIQNIGVFHTLELEQLLYQMTVKT
jgi:hypothetical protein